ncbi:MAG: 2-phospho-L-lactate transferase [Solirubrobacteraceae bacterium]|nr:2-phospho-L-lactate transferase [Solirubrobacteraceae bacterium]
MTVVVLAGGTGGAKLARGMVDVVGAEQVVVVANTADDVEIYGAHVSPDPDLVLFWLADRINDRGWGLEGDTFHAMDRLRTRGEEVWFNLGDEDLEICRDRARRLAGGETLTEAIDALRATLGVNTRVLPMTDAPVRTVIDGTPFQEWMIRAGGKAGAVAPQVIELEGLEAASVTEAVVEAVASAEAVIIGPSNPVISIGPILGVAGMAEALEASPVVAISPFVRGQILKGPTAGCLRALGFTADTAGAAEFYAGRLDGFVADERVDGLPVLVTDVLMDGAAGRARLAREALEFARGLA